MNIRVMSVVSMLNADWCFGSIDQAIRRGFVRLYYKAGRAYLLFL